MKRADTQVTFINFSTTFHIPDSFNSGNVPKPFGVPNISYGTLWSNDIDTFWQFGGQSTTQNYANSIWRFVSDQNMGNWSEVDLRFSNISAQRPVNGAGCNVPSHSTGYYLGGQSRLNGTNNDASPNQSFFHSMTVFDMKTETAKVLDVPDFVPVIGQSLVFFETVTGGILVVVGGLTEIGGVLSPATLAEVFVYDITSTLWFTQQTTDTLGRSNVSREDYNEYGPGIPFPRYHMCTVAAAAPDKTSWNIYVFGGQNDTFTPGDIWALSFPSAVWIRMNTTDYTNNPKTSGSCNLINGRYVLMGDGCDLGPNNTCLSYGWNPLLYDIAQGDWGWTYSPTIEGYYIPAQIYNVIGGTYYGGATSKTPIYTEFASPIISAAFTVPVDRRVAKEYTVLRILPPYLFASALVLWAGSMVLQYYKSLSHPQSHMRNSNTQENWKGGAMRLPFLAVVAVSTIALIVVLGILLSISSSPDPEPSRWTGGLSSKGTWSGQPYVSAFNPAPGEGRPMRGLVSFFLDSSKSGQWDRRNASQRMGAPLYILWNYGPIVFTVLYGLLWQILDAEVKRVEVYYQLSLKGGCLGKKSLSLNYHCFWSPLSILQALRFRQWAVVLSSTGYNLSLIAMPNIQNYVFAWTVYSGGNLDWGGTYSWQVGYVDPYWTGILIGILSANLICVVMLAVILRFRVSCLREDPLGVISIVKLISGSQRGFAEFGLEDKDAFESLETITSKLDFRRFEISSGYQIREQAHTQSVTLPDNSFILYTKLLPTSMVQRTSQVWRALKRTWDFDVGILRSIDSWINGRPQPFMFHPLISLLWITWLLLLLAANSYILVEMTTDTQLALYNFVIPWSPNAYLLVGVFIQSIFQVLERNVRAVSVLHTLRQGYAQADILWTDYTGTFPIVEAIIAFHNKEHLLGYVMLASLATIIYTIMIGSLQSSAGFYGATDVQGDLASVILALVMNMFILVVSIAVACCYTFSPAFPRYPGTLASLLPYVLSSELLIADVKRAMAHSPQKKDQIADLRNLGRRYGFGEFEDSNKAGVFHLGIERNYIDGPDGKEHVKS